MKRFLRMLSLLTCLAVLTVSVPCDATFYLNAFAEEAVEVAAEPAAAPVETPEPTAVPTKEPTAAPTEVPTELPTAAPTEVPVEASAEAPAEAPVMAAEEAPAEEAPAPQENETPEEETAGDIVLPEEDGHEAETTEVPAAEPTEDVQAEATEVPAEEPAETSAAELTAEPTEEPTEVETVELTAEPTAGPAEENPVDYAADASESPAFTEGYAVILEDETAVYDADAEDAKKIAEIGEGVVYALERSEGETDRLLVCFARMNGDEIETAEGWVNASALRPMNPEGEAGAYIEECEQAEVCAEVGDVVLLPIACAPVVQPTEEPAEEPIEENIEEIIEETAEENIEEPVDVPAQEAITEGENPEEGTEEPVPVPEVPMFSTGPAKSAATARLNRSSAVLCKGDNWLKLSVSYTEAVEDGIAPVFVSSHPEIVQVEEDGSLMALNTGTAVITAVTTYGNPTCEVKVLATPTVLTAKADKETVMVGEQGSISHAFDSGEHGCSVRYESLTPETVSVDENGVFTGVAPGFAQIQVTSFTGLTAKVSLGVLSLPDSVSLNILSDLTLAKGESFTFAPVFPEYTRDEYTIVSGNPAALSVSGNTVTALADSGEVTVTIKCANSAATDSCKVYLCAAPTEMTAKQARVKIGVGDSIDINEWFTTAPEGSSGSYSYKSSAAGVAAVDEKGVVTAKKRGSAYITVTSHNGVSVKLLVGVYAAASKASIKISDATLGEGDEAKITLTFPTNYYGLYRLDYDEEALEVTSINTASATYADAIMIKAKKVEEKKDLTFTLIGLNGKWTKSVNLTVYPAPEAISLERNNILLGKGDKKQKVVALNNEADTLTGFRYESMNPDVVAVNASTGLLNAIGITTAPVEIKAYATNGSAVASCFVTVIQAPESITRAATKVKMGVGDTLDLMGDKLSMLQEPMFALNPGDSSATITFKSGAAAYAAVSADGVVTAKKRKTNIALSATAHNGAKSSTKIYVYAAPKSMTIKADRAAYGEGMSGTFTVNFPANSFALYNLDVKAGSGAEIKITKVNNTSAVNKDTYTFEVVKAPVGGADVVISAVGRTNPELKAELIVPVYAAPEQGQVRAEEAEITLGLGENNRYVKGVCTEGTLCDFTYTTDSAIFSVNKTSGKIATKKGKYGTGVVTIASASNPEVTASCTVTVEKAPTKITLDDTAIVMVAGTTVDAPGYTLPEGTSSYATLTSSAAASLKVTQQAVAADGSVVPAKFTALKAGTVTVTYKTFNGKAAKCTVRVVEVDDAAGRIVNAENPLVVGINDTARASLKLPSRYDPAIRFEPMDSGIALEDASGSSCTVVGKVVGTSALGVFVNEEFAGSVSVSVLPAPAVSDIYADSSVRIAMGEGGRSVKAAHGEGVACNFVYTSGNEGYVKVDPDSGTLTPVSVGSTYIRAAAKNNSAAYVDIPVEIVAAPSAVVRRLSKVKLGVGDTYDLFAEGALGFDPEDSSAAMTYKSQYAGYATVDAKGVVTAKKRLSRAITITATPHAGARGTIPVYVYNAAKSATLKTADSVLGTGMEGSFTVNFSTNYYSLYDVILEENSPLEITSIDTTSAVKTDTVSFKAKAVTEPAVTTVTVKARNGKWTSSLEITVLPAPEQISAAAENLTVGMGMKGVKVQGVCPENRMSTFSYASADAGIVKVDAATGELTPVAISENPVAITITARNNPDATAICMVSVVSAPTKVVSKVKKVKLGVGDTYDLFGEGALELEPEGSAASMTYRSAYAGYAAVNADGVVTAKKRLSKAVNIAATPHAGAKATIPFYVYYAATKATISPADGVSLGAGNEGEFTITFPANYYSRYDIVLPEDAPIEITGIDTTTSVRVDTVTFRAADVTEKTSVTANIVAHNGKWSRSIEITVLPKPTSVSVEQNEITVAMNQKGLKVVGVAPEGTLCSFIYESADESVVKVDRETGELTPVSASDTPVAITVTASNNAEATAQCMVTVKPEPASIDRNVTRIKLGVGDSYDLFKVYPHQEKAALELNPANSHTTLTCSSAYSGYVAVDANGVVTAKKVRASDTAVKVLAHSGASATVNVRAYRAPASVNVTANSMLVGEKLSGEFYINFPTDSYGLYDIEVDSGAIVIDEIDTATATFRDTVYFTAGEVSQPTNVTITVKARVGSWQDRCVITVLPGPDSISALVPAMTIAEEETGHKVVGVNTQANTLCGFTYSTEDTHIITVDKDTGAITTVAANDAPAKVVIRANNSDATAECLVTVVPIPRDILVNIPEGGISMGVGDSVGLLSENIISLDPGNSTTTFKFTSSNGAVAGVDSTGKITGEGRGGAVITIETHNKITKKINVYVGNAVTAEKLPEIRLASPEKIGGNMKGIIEVKFPAGYFGRYKLSSDALISIDEEKVSTAYSGGVFTSLIPITLGNVTEKTAAKIYLTSLAEGEKAWSKDFEIEILPGPDNIEASVTGKGGEIGKMGLGEMDIVVQVVNKDEGTACDYEFISNNPEVLTVDPWTGLITPTGKGTATITVKSRNSDAVCTCEVELIQMPYILDYNDLDGFTMLKGDSIPVPLPAVLDALGNECEGGLSFTSSAPTVVKVENGMLYALKAGSAKISATSYNVSDDPEMLTESLNITVVTGEVGVELTPDEETIYINDEYSETLDLVPSFFIADKPDVGLVWASAEYSIVDNENPEPIISVETVIQKGVARGVVTPLAEGDTMVRATTISGRTANCIIHVRRLSKTLALDVETLTLGEGESRQLQPVFDEGCSAKLSYESSDPMAVSVDESGLIKVMNDVAWAEGETERKVTVTVRGQNGLADSVEITVIPGPDEIVMNLTELILKPEESVVLKPILKSAYEVYCTNLSYHSSDTDVVVVDDAGLVTAAMFEGESTVTITTCNGLSVKCLVRVVAADAETKASFSYETASIVNGDSASVALTLNKEAIDRGYFIRSSNSDVLSIDDTLAIEAHVPETMQADLESAAIEVILELVLLPEPAPETTPDPEATPDPMEEKEGESEGEVAASCSVTVIKPADVEVAFKHLYMLPENPGELEYILRPADLIGKFSVSAVGDISVKLNEAKESEIEGYGTALVTSGATLGTKEVHFAGHEWSAVGVIDVVEGKYRALIIPEYLNSSRTGGNLPFAKNNRDYVEAALKSARMDGKSYQISVMANNPTEAAIEAKIDTFFADSTPFDVNFIYVVSHGYYGKSTGYYFGIAPTRAADSGLKFIETVTTDEIHQWIDGVPTGETDLFGDPVIESMGINGEVVLVLNSCQSGAFIGQFASGANYAAAHVTGPKQWLEEHPNVSVMTTQWGGWPASFFNSSNYKIEFLTYGLTHGMGKTMYSADPASGIPADSSKDGLLTVSELFAYTKKKGEATLQDKLKNYKSAFVVAGYSAGKIPSGWSQKMPYHLGENAESLVVFAK